MGYTRTHRPSWGRGKERVPEHSGSMTLGVEFVYCEQQLSASGNGVPAHYILRGDAQTGCWIKSVSWPCVTCGLFSAAKPWAPIYRPTRMISVPEA
jgi:hypothetical protein